MTVFRALWCVLFSLVVICTGEKVSIPVNPNCTFHTSIGSVVHDTDSRRFIIDLHQHRRCENPVFHVRLSGTALYLLDLVQHDYVPVAPENPQHFISKRKNIYYFGYPELIDDGTYFLEILVLYCGGFNPLNFELTCVEEHWHGVNVVNTPYSFNVTRPPAVMTAKRPRWLLGNKDSVNYTLDLLPTRYQHRYCGDGAVCEHIKDASELWQYRLYDFVDAPNWRDAYHRLSALTPNSTVNTTVCFVGASHARELTVHARALVTSVDNLVFEHVDTKFPPEFNVGLLRSKYPCDYAVIGYGQWPVSWAARVPCNADCYMKHMKNVIGSVVPAVYSGPTKVFLRSVNYNGMGTFMTACPPYDHRNPAVIAMMNGILGQLTAAHNVDYIDLNHIMGPMWDSALDYCHPVGKVFTAEAEWILNYIFSAAYEDHQHYSGNSGGGKSWRKDMLVRFTDSATVYLIRDGVARAFPNGNTFMAMGFEWGQIKVMTPDKRAVFMFSDDLPSA